ncbi:hypothetical protein GPL17_19060 [Bradyrhizobium yuanmingense]|uniref:hypothetical protein n=1 Tax=Bradyrhizobium yuanmingense TaxID=108015 RepID=UPI0012F8DB44|nr:hypothetical protein [Bradyrhizobium yuanmingense]MVT52584.1 hypothetical protein [Bradyrhizobium yuanmingense]
MTKVGPNQYFLGRCLFFHEKFTRLEPLAQSATHGWTRIADRKRQFPPAGNVFSFDKNTLRCPEGTVRYFRVEENKRTSSKEEHDQYVVLDAHEPIEILDFSHIQSPEEVRCAVVEEGIAIEQASTPEVIIAMKGRSCVRLHLDLDPMTRRLRPKDLHGLEKLTLFRLAPHHLHGERVEGRLFLCPTDPIESIGAVDWSTNADFMQRTLRRLKRSNAFQAEEGMGDVSRRAIEKLALAVRSGEVLGADLREIEATRERLKPFVSGVEANLEFVETLAVELMKSPSIARKLEERISSATEAAATKVRTELEPAIRSEILQQLGDQIAQRDQLSQEVAVLEETVHRSRIELSKISDDHELQRAAIVSEGQAFLKSFSNVLESVGRYANPERATGVAAAAAWNRPQNNGGMGFAIGELKNFLKSLAERTGFDLTEVLGFDALLRGGEVPLLFGRDVEALLAAYARSVLDGQLWRLSVDPATIGFDDLWRGAATGEPTVLAGAWSAAAASADSPILVVIEDISNAPVKNWMPQFLRLTQSDVRPRNLLLCATLSDGSGMVPPEERQALFKAIPFEVKATKAGVVAAIFDEAEDGKHSPTGRLNGQLLCQCLPDNLNRLSAELARVCESQSVARRAVRVFKSVLATMEADEALRFACEFANFESDRRVLQNPTGHIQRSLGRLAATIGFEG